ncbi:ATP-dependent DNA helicase 2 subunit 2 [Ceratocystis lukuohia]|uniref:ATP-dependent DNA helicase II subunit 2 n=1 Tax=Ceratocystis lukuohia TaxID=2019550 RepID=A0ABR4MLF7_9PEZI
MAEKEALVFVIDLGQTMAAHESGRDESNFDWGMRYVWDKISHIASMNRKTLNVGILGFRTEETNNIMEDDASYHHIKVIQPLGPCMMSDLQKFRQAMKPSQEFMGDAISALILATSMINEFTKKLKYIRHIILVTDGRAPMDDSDLPALTQQMRDCGIKLTILGIDFDDADQGFKEEDKDEIKKQNEASFRQLALQTNGECANIDEAINELDIPVVKTTRPYKAYDGFLSLGTEGHAPTEYAPNNLMIGVERYFRTKIAAPMVATTIVARRDGQESLKNPTAEDADTGIPSLEAVKMSRTYVIKDPNAPGGKRDVPFEKLAKGYEYGRTAVYISKSDENVTNLETKKSFSILGFVEKSSYDTVLNMGESCVIHARSSEPSSALKLAALATAMENSGAYAVARYVAKDWKEPQLLILIPDSQEQCLYDVPLPFSEDVRRYQFPPLDRVPTVGGGSLTKHQLLPEKALDDAMSDFVDSMDLSQWAIDEDGNPAEYITTENSFNPLLHRIKMAVQNRGVYPERPVSGIPPSLIQFSLPADELVASVEKQINALVKAAEVKKVPPKAKGKHHKEVAKPLSNLDIDSLLGVPKKSGLSNKNAIPDFIRLLETANDNSDVADAVQQMGSIVCSLITDGFGENTDDRIIETLGVMRREMISLEQPALYNDFLRGLKARLISGELGGDRRELWFKAIKIARLSLIRSDQCQSSTVSVQEAAEFYNSKEI